MPELVQAVFLVAYGVVCIVIGMRLQRIITKWERDSQ